MLPIARAVNTTEYAQVAAAMIRVIRSMLDEPDRWKIDTTKLHMGDLFYVPGRYKNAVADDGTEFVPENAFRVLDGEIWEPEMWIRLADMLMPIPPEPVRPERTTQHSFNSDSSWDPEVNCADKLSEYRCAGDDRTRKLMSLMQSLADSARFWRYDLSAPELADFIANEQAANPPHKPSSRYKPKTLLEKAASSIEAAASFVSEQVYQAPVDPPDRWIDEPDDVMAEAMTRRQQRTSLNSDATGYTNGNDRTRSAGTTDERSFDDVEPPPGSDGAREREPGNESTAGEGSAETEPLDIFGSLTPEPSLTPDMLPPTIREFAFDTADRLGITPETVAMAALAVAASAIHGGITIQVTEDWTWTEQAIIWCKAIGDSGVVHTAALNAACKPLEQMERDWREADQEALRKYERAYAAYKEEVRVWDRLHAQGKTEEPEPREPREPDKRRLVSTDFTMEKLGDILEHNPRGILLKIDELAAFTGGFDAYRGGKTGKDRPNALKLWDGGQFLIDRMDRDVVVPNWAAGVVGKVQENKLASMAASLTDDGLMQRFLVYKIGTVGMGSHRAPDRMAIERYEAMIRSLVCLEPTGHPIRLSEGAQEYQREVERISYALKTLPMLTPALRAHAAKMNGMFARLVLVMHAIEDYVRSGYLCERTKFLEVQPETAKRARGLMVKFLIPSAIRIYSEYFTPSDEPGSDARWIAGHILAHRLVKITTRDIYRINRDLDKDRKRLERAFSGLVDATWLVAAPPGWAVNPLVHTRFAERADQERQQRADIKAKIANSRTTLTTVYG
jgi:hypothetical protein